MSYRHLTTIQREIIVRELAKLTPANKIADILGIHRSTVYREIKRNSIKGEYSGIKAQKLYRKRRVKCHREKKLLIDSVLYDTVALRLEEYWSPEQIVGRHAIGISVPSIYRAINAGLLPREIKQKCLRCHGKPYRRRGIKETRGHLSGTTSIDRRTEEESSRLRLGDIEGDTVLGLQGTGAVVTLVDRKSRYLLCGKLPYKGAGKTADSIINILSHVPCLSLTLDNGKEFAGHAEISRELGIPVYFAHPHSPWQRGTNENTNKLLRQFIPKGADIAKVTEQELKRYTGLLNNRPRKCLGFATPAEVFLNDGFCRT